MSSLIKIFWNKNEGRVRAGWRIVIQFAVMMLFTVVFAFIDPFFNESLPESTIAQGDTILFPLWLLLSSLLAVLLVGRYIDRRRIADFGLHFSSSWWGHLGFGAVLAACLITGIFLIERAMGWVSITETSVSKIDGWTFPASIALALATVALAATTEELVARGYQIRNLAEGLNLRSLGAKGALVLAVLCTSALFGLLHALNPSTTTISTSGLALAGIFYGIAYVLTGELALPIGFHIAWNFFENSVFGFPVSGENFGASFVCIQQSGPELWTGGAFGPEAGLLSIGAHLLGILAVVVWVRLRRGKVVLLEELSEPLFRKRKVRPIQ